MRRFRVSAVAALASAGIALPATSAARSNAAPRQHCSRTFTRPMFEGAVRATYTGTHEPRKGAYGRLWRYARCGRDGPHGYGVRWAREVWGIGASRWDRRRTAAAQAAAFTGYVVSGDVSTFGPPTDAKGTTADGGKDDRACIAIRDDSTLGRTFLVTIGSHHANLEHCDWGPASSTGRAIDVTGAGAEAMGLDPYNFPTDSYGTARELR